MKCTNCGKNTANYHYKYNINGKVTEAHLCSECAEKMGITDSVFSESEKMFNSVFDDFFRDPFFSSPFRSLSPFSSFGMPTMVMPKIAIAFPKFLFEEEKTGNEATDEKQEAGEKTDTLEKQIDPELKKKREINELREKMRLAAENEDYEKAAELRDKIKAMEKEG